jgi:hypothetical protein
MFQECPFLEASFSLYHPDMVYANPKVVEVDLLLVFNGGYACLELKKKPSDAHRDSLKFFVNGLAPQPVVYVSKRSIRKGESELGISNPLVIPHGEISFKECLLDKLREWREKFDGFFEERRELFSIDNFLCMLLLYASPKICRLLLDEVLSDEEKNLSPLIKRRISLIKRAKGLDNSTGLEEIPAGEKEKSEGMEKLVVLVPTIKSEVLINKIAEALGGLRAGEVVLLCTKQSAKECCEIIGMIKDKIKSIKCEIVEGDLEESWSSKAVEEASNKSVIVTAAEIPKGVLLKLVEKLADEKKSVKLASLLPRPVKKGDFLKSLSSLISALEGRGECCEIGEREEIKLECINI